MSVSIAASADVHPTAEIGAEVSIGPFAYVGPHAVIGDGCVLASHAVVRRGARLGPGVRVDSFAVVGGDPQMIGFDHGIESGVTIGAGTFLREHVTVHRSTKPGERTIIGEHCYLMANSHVGHDSEVADRVTLANNVMLAGHVLVGKNAFLGGGSGIHQFVRVGEGAMVGGNASISLDVPPFTIVAERNALYGLNVVGLRRRKHDSAQVAQLKRCFRAVFGQVSDVRARAREAALELEGGVLATPFLAFFEGGKRGFVRLRRADGRQVGAEASAID
ncbi:MAG: acyl-ACP--UDP-N-acetylglucosamine O-acyltransferase [Planctomycetes bacterium]|nr:acyl-ACP--UDP-N-acetylglucosamine O-acyltransferase [Planctomycetota bacterium]